MSFYSFKLDKLVIKHQRGNITDLDVVTFTVFVNQLDRGHGTATFPVASNTEASTHDITEDGLPAYPAAKRFNMSKGWEVGPLEIEPGDVVHVVYTGTNISDEQLSSLGTQQQDEIELKLLSAVATAAVGALTGGLGLVSEGIAAALGAIGDPVGSFLGYEPQGPCNGPVFSDAVQFSGSGLDNLGMAPLTHTLYPGTPYPRAYTSPYPGRSFTHTYTDQATHNTDICGHIAETDVWFEVFRVPYISVRSLLNDRFPPRWPTEFGPGLRQYGQPGTTISIKSLLGVRP